VVLNNALKKIFDALKKCFDALKRFFDVKQCFNKIFGFKHYFDKILFCSNKTVIR
jgi:hypothetical protein